jgi:5-methylcytosine-specific restriction endonuclease McrA
MDIQRLLTEGLFTATYKYALLAALADLSIELGDDSGEPLRLGTFALAEKFVEYYWGHAAPYNVPGEARVLRQNTGSQAKIIALVGEARTQHGDSLPKMMRNGRAWNRLVRRVEAVVKLQPLWKLQTVGKEKLEFLYVAGTADEIELRVGVAYCFRRFYPLVQDALRSAWLRDVRSMNGDLLGEVMDLREFLFGAERNALSLAKPLLSDLQGGKCFYCLQPIRLNAGQVDHFIPWAKYPVDLAHNFVLADERCNAKKRDRIAHVEHLSHWGERNQNYGDEMTSAMKDRFACDLPSAKRIAYWAYSQTEAAQGLTWLRNNELVVLLPAWRKYIP